VREQRVVLEHHADAAGLGRHVDGGAADELMRQRDTAGLGALQARDGAQQGGLAAARRPDQDPDLACLQAERHAVDRGLRRPR
jgi:hypothetical protein